MKWITDMGQSLTLTGRGLLGELKDQMHIPRYGVWEFNVSRGKMEVIETSDDLGLLKTKHGSDLKVIDLEVKNQIADEVTRAWLPGISMGAKVERPGPCPLCLVHDEVVTEVSSKEEGEALLRKTMEDFVDTQPMKAPVEGWSLDYDPSKK